MKFEKIKSVKSVGLRKAYDLSIKGKEKGYLVNGIQTHNSGGDARSSFSLEDTMTLFEVTKKFNRKYPKVVKEAEKLEGVMKNKGVHAAGVIVDKEDLYEGKKCVLVRGKKDEIVVN